ncbi:competence protein ComK [Neobacillus niacini]|uniref:competence protein ComK n=1 Tax=Neobacillus niacini TaxID=86668 RepID=UPI0028576769|nr:competence protein ComK [Neobacillus niacini]MDR6999687.1 competence protein ComK [Neobacillus niacini]
MEIKNNYLINGKTVLFYGECFENGESFTHVVEGDKEFLVAMSPVKLIDQSLMSYGSNFSGALKSSKKQLGDNKCMYPIKIDATLDIWLFPTKSYKKENCVWFNLNHVKNPEALGVKFTRVFLSYGHTIEIAMKASAFRDKRQSAQDLKDMITSNTKNSLGRSDEPVKGFIIVEKKGRYSCKSKRNKEK